jgi:hypothetical protein
MRTQPIVAAAAAVLLALPSLAHAARVVIINGDPPGVGFNDPTPATPVGGNAGTTKGEQALIVFERAAAIWGAALDSPVDVEVYSLFAKLTCTANSAVLGSAGALFAEADFRNAPLRHTWYPVALANKMAGTDLVADDPRDPADFGGADLRARFNSGIGAPDCLASTGWYYGLDTGHGAGQINLLTVVLHEIGHGLGFASFANVSTGAWLNHRPDVYSHFYYDFATGKSRLEMSDAERQASAVSGKIVWRGETVTDDAPAVLGDTPTLFVTAPASATGKLDVGTASFGAPISTPGVGGPAAIAVDAGVGAASTDACTAILNPGAISGRIAIVDRGGGCAFTIKAKNVQNAGAIGVVVADNVPGPVTGMSGTDPSVTIPVVRITLAAGDALKALVPSGLELRIGGDPDRKAGMLNGFVKLYSPDPVEPGSSVSHFDVSTSPNQLMEPAINADLRLTVSLPHDLTHSLLRDIGWFADADLDTVDDEADACLPSDLRPTVFLGTVDTGASNAPGRDGCTANDRLVACAGATGYDVSCVTGMLTTLTGSNDMSASDIGRIVSTAASGKR